MNEAEARVLECMRRSGRRVARLATQGGAYG